MGSTCEAALLTAYGSGAIAVIRVRGIDAWTICARHLRTSSGSCPDRPVDRRLIRGQWHAEGRSIDDVLACVRQETPDECSVDLCIHGGVRVVQRVLMSLEHSGAPVRLEDDSSSPTPPVELLTYEADRLLQRAPTRRVARFLIAQRELLGRELRRLAKRVADSPEEVRCALATLKERMAAARLLIQGIRLAVVGPVNAGKSTLANRLLGQSRSLVSEQPGTTRDVVAESGSLDGFPITVFDTPGLRTRGDALELEAIDRALALVESADLLLLVLDQAGDWPAEFIAHQLPALPRRPMVAVLNKRDLGKRWNWPHDGWLAEPIASVEVSASTGMGLGELGALILRTLDLDRIDYRVPAPFTDRQSAVLDETLSDPSASPAGLRAGLERLMGSDWLEKSAGRLV